MRAENCRSCGKFCESGHGYLYRDTHGRPNYRTGRFGWFVKCEECHTGAKTRLTVSLEKQAAARANEPVVRSWSVSQVKKWVISRTVHEGDVAIQVDGGSFVTVVSYRDRINGRFTAPTGYNLEQYEFEGKPLSEKAEAHLSPQILSLVTAVQKEEHEAGETAVAKLVAAGATATPYLSGHAWSVVFQGGSYTLWGNVDGGNKVTGVTQPNERGRWVETTAEAMIADLA